jgi:hypothetical protein
MYHYLCSMKQLVSVAKQLVQCFNYSLCYYMEQIAKELNGRHFIPYRQIFVTVENKKLFNEITNFKYQR